MRRVAFAVAFTVVRAACALGGAAADELPPVPREARAACEKGEIQIERTFEKKKRGEAVTTDDWDVALGFFTEAQQKAPTSPTILKWLAIAHEGRGAYVAAKAWLNAYLAAFPRAKDRLALVQHTLELERQAQVVIRSVFTEALRAAALVPQPAPVEMGGHVAYVIPVCMVSDRGPGGTAWTTNSRSVHSRTEVMFLQADAGDVEGAFTNAKALADGIRQGSWDRPASNEWHRRFSVWKAGHDAMAAAGDWAGAMALYAEHDRAGLLDRKGAGAFHLVFRDVRGVLTPQRLRDEIRAKIDKGRDQPLALSDWLALANEVSRTSDEPGLELRLKQIRGGALKPAELVMAMAKTAVPIGQALLRVRALEGRAADQAIRIFQNARDTEEVRKLLAERPELVSLRCSAFGDTALSKAVVGTPRVKDAVELLLAKGADPDARSHFGVTPLHYAAMYNCVASARLLLAKGAAVNAQMYEGSTPLHMAASKTCLQVIKALLDAGADVNARTRDGKTALDVAKATTRPDTFVIDMGTGVNSSPENWDETIKLLTRAAGGKDESKPPKPWWRECRFAMANVLGPDDEAKEVIVLRCVAGMSVGQILKLESKPLLCDHDLARATLTEKDGLFGIKIVLTEEGKAKLAKATAAVAEKRFAIVSRGDVLVAVTVREPLAGGVVEIWGNMSKAEVEKLVARLTRK